MLINLIPAPYRMLAALIAVAALCSASAAGSWWVRGSLADTEIATLKADQADQFKDIAERTQALADQYAKEAATRSEVFGSIDRQLYEVKQYVERKNDALRTDLLAGNQRLSVLVRSLRPAGTVPGAAAGDPAGAGMDHGTATAELDGAAAAGLVGLTGEGDTAIIKLTACQAMIRAVQQGQPAPERFDPRTGQPITDG